MITGKTKLIGILGWPVEHSLSPSIHNTAFLQLGIDFSYLPLQVNPQNLSKAVTGLKALGFVGANITIPHKVEVIPLLDEIDKNAQLIGAVNTIVIKDERCIGYNTDADGFINSLKANNVPTANIKVAMLGAGGAARAVVCGLLNNGAQQVIVGTRSQTKAKEFANLFPTSNVRGIGWHSEEFTEALKTTDLLINSTPLGMYPHTEAEPPVVWSILNKHSVVCDIVYNPYKTVFLKNAASRGHQIVTGEGMLVEQGAIAFELWTGLEAPRFEMYKIVHKLLI